MSKIINFFFSICLILILFTLALRFLLTFLFRHRLVIFDFGLIVLGGVRFNFILLFDIFRIVFLFAVTIISGSVYTFRRSYIRPDKYFVRFHFLLLSFVASMVLLILRPNLISVLIGWDGLGISSYLLVIYYRRAKSYNSGMVTILSNRVGDALIIVRLCYCIFLPSLNLGHLFFSYRGYYTIILFILVVASITKRAQIPFSAWLPAAMAAPTPVSSLVHSSTLVTAGVYLIFRFESLLVSINLRNVLLIIGSLTILMARLRAFFEIDMKKIVALSTLSQLGVIMSAIGAGFRVLGFFHLLAHAFFKALLFIRTGNLIHGSESYQDIRVMGGGSEVIPFTNSIVIRASLSLCGLPFMAAFYSKEIIIESLLINNISIYSYFLLIAGIFITVFYRTRFLVNSFTWVNRQRALILKNDLDLKVNIRILILFLPAVIGGRFVSQYLKLGGFLLIPSNLKFSGIFLIMRGVVIYILAFKSPVLEFKLRKWRIGSLWILPFFTRRFPIERTLNLGDFFNKIRDFSWLYYSFSRFFLIFNKLGISEGLAFQPVTFIRLLTHRFLIFLLVIIWVRV